ncbi:hypothetical protein [Pseudomonas argentinensis]|uniref:hypothetical protein n=1 Tax=Phytopseudomonas argentinensis TaxID=289370 RepID=UPI001113946E|nr:hypothetical protein [Pseudomonas argentinensis]
MNTVEDAYEELARGIVDFAAGRSWERACCKCEIYDRMASATYWLEGFGNIDRDAFGWPDSSINIGKAALFIRDDILAAGGQRIWGLTFSLFPDGKFDIEYDYSRPKE